MHSNISNFRSYFLIFLAVSVLLKGGFLIASELLLNFPALATDRFETHLRFFKSATATNVIFGDSHAQLGFTGVPGFINLAHESENIEVIKGKAEIYFEDKKPNLVILQADPHMFSMWREAIPYGLTVDEEQADIEGYLDNYRNSRSVIEGLIRSIRVLSADHRPNLLNYWKDLFRNEELDPVSEFLSDGAYVYSGTWSSAPAETRRKHAERRVQNQEPIELSQSRLLPVYEDLLRFLIEEGARVCLVGFPVAQEQREVATRYPAFHRARSYFQRLSGRYGVPYVDFWDAVDDQSAFYDSDHLRLDSAPEFARRAASECFSLENPGVALDWRIPRRWCTR